MVANLSHCSEQELDAIEWALKHKGDIEQAKQAMRPSRKEAARPFHLKEGHSVGAIWALLEVARRRGIVEALGDSFQGKLALWQVLARLLNQGSRLSSVRWAPFYDVGSVLGLERGFDENDLYGNLSWLAKQQEALEKALFRRRPGGGVSRKCFCMT